MPTTAADNLVEFIRQLQERILQKDEARDLDDETASHAAALPLPAEQMFDAPTLEAFVDFVHRQGRGQPVRTAWSPVRAVDGQPYVRHRAGVNAYVLTTDGQLYAWREGAPDTPMLAGRLNPRHPVDRRVIDFIVEHPG